MTRTRLDGAADAPVATVDEARRLAELGRLSASLVHELRQPLFAVKALAQVVRQDSAQADALLPQLLEQVTAMEQLVEAHAELGRRPAAQREVFDVRVPLAGARVLMERRATAARVALRFDAPEAVAAIGSPRAVQQAVVNLVQNAVEAVQGQSDGAVRVMLCPARGGGACVRVEDNGPGLSASVRARLFEPFLTTKGEGTGLGLALSRDLVAASGGDLRFCAEHDAGAAFEIVLPGPPPR
jgi:C4-dicarboxylate-specific signal transduction histidine kinase